MNMKKITIILISTLLLGFLIQILSTTIFSIETTPSPTLPPYMTPIQPSVERIIGSYIIFTSVLGLVGIGIWKLIRILGNRYRGGNEDMQN